MADEAWGIDFEAEIAVITDDVPMGVGAEEAASHIQLIMLVNDVSLRNLCVANCYSSRDRQMIQTSAVTLPAVGI